MWGCIPEYLLLCVTQNYSPKRINNPKLKLLQLKILDGEEIFAKTYTTDGLFKPYPKYSVLKIETQKNLDTGMGIKIRA